MHKTYRSIDRIESLEINLYLHDELIYDTGDKNIPQRKESLFSKWCWENCIPTYERFNLNPYFTSYTKINSKWIKDLDIDLKL